MTRLTTLAKQMTFVALFAGAPCLCAGHELTLDECLEGSDFIMHAAMSRENGMTREAFLERMENDIHAIQAFPAELRWFVQDDDDAELLTSAARLVFDAPREPQRHQSEFLATCASRMGAVDTQAGVSDLSPTGEIVADPSTR